jgi:hypothetical protein
MMDCRQESNRILGEIKKVTRADLVIPPKGIQEFGSTTLQTLEDTTSELS